MKIIILLFVSFTSPFFSCQFSLGFDSLAADQTLIDNGETLVSKGQKFEFGFFSPSESRNRYVGIWFENIPERTVVWVANKNSPLTDSSGILTVTPTGNIVLIDDKTNSIIWTSNSSLKTVGNPTLQLLDSGNLVVKDRDQNSRNYLWQSFDHPSDTLIPGMKLGWNLRNNQEWYLTSWKSLQDPSTGLFTFRVATVGLPEIVLHQGSEVAYRSGPWDGVRFGGSEMKPNTVFKPIFVSNTSDVYYTFENADDSIVSRFVVNQFGLIQHLAWSMTRNEWIVLATVQADNCDKYGLCGSYGICNANKNPMCSCPEGFTPRQPQDWARFDCSGGCSRKTQLNCSLQAGFRKFPKLKLPETTMNIQENKTARNEGECEAACLRNCSCMGYATIDISGCVMWFGDLMDIRTVNEGGQDLYIRMPASELASSRKRRGVILGSVVAGVVAISLIISYVFRKRAAGENKAALKSENDSQQYIKKIGDEDVELPLFDLYTISAVTSNFSFANKIGQGGFGAVYKGILLTGHEIAVKRLSKSSGQGLEEFKNEVILIAKLQHRNLVRLLGCCIHDDERMLVYEYMSNQSLDLLIFNETRSRALDWQKRFDIIVGIARGLLYLHRDSRLRIIHRDLKASNILLDGEMNPKISDFGLARTFGGDQHHDNTSRVMGTFGYMAPEYAIDGLFSVKSDVFSFGVLALEIVSGKKNRGFCHPDHDLNLLGHAWRLWNEGDPLELIDSSMESSAPVSEVLRCIHVALLCVQQRPDDRPAMSTVLLMLDIHSPMLPQPTQPGFYSERSIGNSDSSSTGKKLVNSTEVTITLLQGR